LLSGRRRGGRESTYKIVGEELTFRRRFQVGKPLVVQMCLGGGSYLNKEDLENVLKKGVHSSSGVQSYCFRKIVQKNLAVRLMKCQGGSGR